MRVLVSWQPGWRQQALEHFEACYWSGGERGSAPLEILRTCSSCAIMARTWGWAQAPPSRQAMPCRSSRSEARAHGLHLVFGGSGRLARRLELPLRRL